MFPIQYHQRHYSLPTSSIKSHALDYSSFDARRSALEQHALAVKQEERRVAEEAVLRHRQQKLSKERLDHQQAAFVERLVQRRVEEEVARAIEQQRRDVAHAIAVRAKVEQERKDIKEYLAVKAAVELRREHVAAAQLLEHHRRRVAQAQAQAQTQAQASPPLERNPPRKAPTSTSLDEGHSDPIALFFHLVDATRSTNANSTPSSSPSGPISTPTPHANNLSSPPTLQNSESLAAAETLQDRVSAHLARRTALATLSSLSTTLSTHQSDFIPPTPLVFRPSPPSSSNDDSVPARTPEPTLAYSTSNATFLAYEDHLVTLLSKIDEIASGGDPIVKEARKKLVGKVESELRKLDEIKAVEWNKAQGVSEAEGQTFVTTTRETTSVSLESESAGTEADGVVSFTIPDATPPVPVNGGSAHPDDFTSIPIDQGQAATSPEDEDVVADQTLLSAAPSSVPPPPSSESAYSTPSLLDPSSLPSLPYNNTTSNTDFESDSLTPPRPVDVTTGDGASLDGRVTDLADKLLEGRTRGDEASGLEGGDEALGRDEDGFVVV